MAVTATLSSVVNEFPPDLRSPMWHFTEVLEERFIIPHQDFTELRQAVERLARVQEELATAQARTEQRVDQLAAAQERTEQRVEQLAAAQERTEQRVEQLAAAQERTEQRVEQLAAAQERTEQRVEQLAAAQERTEQRVEQLAAAQERTEQAVKSLADAVSDLRKTISDQFSKMGSRWGLQAESTFRQTIRRIFRDMEGVTVKQGAYGGRQVDVVIRNGEHILLEITSSMKSSDIDKLYASGDEYREKEGVEPILMVAANYVPPSVMRRVLSLPRPIEIFSYEEQEDEA